MFYGASVCRIYPWTSRESDATLSGQYDLFGTLEAKLGHINLIKNISLMWWNLQVQPTSNYSLAMALQHYIGIRS